MSGGLGRLLSAVPGGCDGCRAGSAPHLRLDRNPRDHAGRHTGDALWRHLPVLSGPVQGGGPQCMSTGFAVRAEPARLRALSALRSGDPVRTAGALANILQDSAPAFETQASAIKRRLLSGTVLQSDETSARVGKRTFWTWVFHHADSACFVTT